MWTNKLNLDTNRYSNIRRIIAIKLLLIIVITTHYYSASKNAITS